MSAMTLRAFRPADALTLSEIHLASENAALDAWGAGVRLDFDVDDAAKGWLQPGPPPVRVAVLGDVVVGWSVPRLDGHLAGLYVHPDHWREGIGRALLVDAESVMREAGVDQADLFVMSGHTGGRRFYEAHGWAPTTKTRTVEFADRSFEQVRYVKELRGA